ncbi:autotransporter outer membrane beta-barrel domain-containing protein [Bradyrhizobium cenepequi]|uniref:autotransporter outer membrane beta-barrel domain-containing protein n=1 Tax=Bradyrhizobium cenepequi TaxID=2821403 RepID=UPI00289FF137|nr:autotransporter outer membrane beta-barrel domain-containing protein [Bradyrhizobium cenepequi]
MTTPTRRSTAKSARALVDAPSWSTWLAGFGGVQTADGNGSVGSNNTRSSIYAGAVGLDYRVSPDTLVGFALTGGETRFEVTNGGSGHSDLFQAGMFVRHNAGPAYVGAALAYGWQSVTTDRDVAAGGSLDRLRAEFDAKAFSGRAEGGYRFVTPWMGVTPYAAAQVIALDLPSYAERAIAGAGTFALAYASKEVTVSRSEFGFRTDKSFNASKRSTFNPCFTAAVLILRRLPRGRL